MAIINFLLRGNEIFSTKYYPDLKPYIPNSAEEKH